MMYSDTPVGEGKGGHLQLDDDDEMGSNKIKVIFCAKDTCTDGTCYCLKGCLVHHATETCKTAEGSALFAIHTASPLNCRWPVLPLPQQHVLWGLNPSAPLPGSETIIDWIMRQHKLQCVRNEII